jgi:hypothetical protein
MAVNGERASKRDHVIAFVAIVVTGVVSGAGVFVSCQSSRDSQRTAREAQRESARAQRAQADTAASGAVSDSSTGGDAVYRKRRSTELRSVLDRATASLQRLATAAADDIQASRGLTGTRRPEPDDPSHVRAHAPSVRAAQRSHVWLSIRLGRRASIVKAHADALGEFDASLLIFPTKTGGYSRAATARDRWGRWKDGERYFEQFLKQARELLVGSQLPK